MNYLKTNKDGQAMTEFIVGLVAVLVIVSGLCQIASITKVHTDSMFSARKEAGQRSMSGILSSAVFIKNWNENADEKRYTRDDTATPDSLQKFNDNIVEYAADTATGWDVIKEAEYDAIPNLRNSTAIGTQFGLVKGEAGGSVELLPIFQHLIYAQPEIDLKCTVWMTWTKGIY